MGAVGSPLGRSSLSLASPAGAVSVEFAGAGEEEGDDERVAAVEGVIAMWRDTVAARETEIGELNAALNQHSLRATRAEAKLEALQVCVDVLCLLGSLPTATVFRDKKRALGLTPRVCKSEGLSLSLHCSRQKQPVYVAVRAMRFTGPPNRQRFGLTPLNCVGDDERLTLS